MTAPHSLPAHRARLHVPAWLIAALLAAAVASGVTAWIDDSGSVSPAPAATGSEPIGPTTCIDDAGRIPGLDHC
jgi:hypothetical protein